jgi:ABC-type Fe3+-hydroxamate transport system substrate-binding protein
VRYRRTWSVKMSAALFFVLSLCACASSSPHGSSSAATPIARSEGVTHVPSPTKPLMETTAPLVTRVQLQVLGAVRPYLVYNVIVGLNQHASEIVAYHFDQRTLILVVDFKPGVHATAELVEKIVRSAGFSSGAVKVETLPLAAAMEEGPGWFKPPPNLSSGPARWVELNFY